jgi:transcriptional regulator with XRE-family HTH domain
MREQPDAVLAALLKRMREERDLTQEHLAHKADLTASALSRIERGLNSPGWVTVLRLIQALDVSLTDFAIRREAAARHPPTD